MTKLRLYEAFRAVMISGSVTSAAKLLRRTQPSVSRTLVELEEYAGAKLFERQGRRLSPTPEAYKLLPDVEAALKTLNDLDRQVETLAAPTPVQLSLAVAPAFSMEIAARLTTALRNRFPDLRITLLIRDSSVILDLIHNGDADIGLGGVAVGNHHDQRVLGNFNLVCAMPAGHRLAAHSEITGSDLDDENFIAFDHELAPIHVTRQIVKQTGGHPRTVVETQRTHTACALVASGVGVTLVEPMTVLSFPPEKIVMRRFSPSISHSLVLLNRLEPARSALLRSIEALARNIADDAAKEITERLEI